MKLFISILLIALLSFVSSLYLPWWTISIAAFVVTALILQQPWKAFLSGFIAVFLLWFFLAWWISSRNDHVLGHKVAVLIVQSDSVWLLLLATALIGGLIAGFGALAGSYLSARKSAQ